MLLLIAILISIGLAAYVTAPLLAAAGANETVPVDITPLAELKRRRLVVYENLQDLEFEYKAGKIARPDYEALRDGYTAEAAELMLASQDAEKPALSEDFFIEREVAARRARRKASKPVEDYTCPRCKFENPVPVKFCGECGAPLMGHKRKL